jgi:hypothetical protein
VALPTNSGTATQCDTQADALSKFKATGSVDGLFGSEP